MILAFLTSSGILLIADHPSEAPDSSSLLPQASLGQPPKNRTPPGEARDNSNVPPQESEGGGYYYYGMQSRESARDSNELRDALRA